MSDYGRHPTVVVPDFNPGWYEYMHYLYLPVKMAGDPYVALPPRLDFLRVLVHGAIATEEWDGYVYVTARRGWASPDNPLNRPGWHTDGFGSTDINFIWTDKFPTRFAVNPFVDISDSHVLSAKQFEHQVKTVVTYPERTVLRLDPFVVHATPEIPEPGGERSFFKISLGRERYNLLGNSHNYLLEYDWKMWSRSEIRNDPAYAGGDFAPQT